MVKKQYECKVTCDLFKTCKIPYMKMSGSLDSEILIIGEAPGGDEDIEGKPFVGDAGKLLRHALALANVSKFCMTNAVRCRPPGNRDPKTAELKSCKVFLEEDIQKLPNLKLIVLIGNYAMMSILGHKGVLEHSGTYSTLELFGKTYGILCLMHPSYVLQNQGEMNNFLNHVGRIPNALTGSLIDKTDEGDYHYIVSKPDWKELASRLRQSTGFVYDLETNSLDPYETGTKITCISFSITPREAYAIEIIDSTYEMIKDDLKEIMEDASIEKYGQNIKFDNLWLLEKWGIKVNGTAWDTSIGQYLLDENESHGLKSMAWKYTKLGGYDKELVNGEPHMAIGTNLLKYSCIDSDITNRIKHIQVPLVQKDEGLLKLKKELLLPVTEVLLGMERRGVKVDSKKLAECKVKVNEELVRLEAKLFNLPSVVQFQNDNGIIFNPRSSPQLRDVLFKYEGLVSIKKTEKTKAPSTDRSVLEFYRDQSKVCDILCDHSTYSTMKSKMIKELEEYTVNGRIHTHYWVTETSTGRSSSDKPNLQNVTKGKKDVVGIRDVFVADEGFDLLECDYSQHEVRCMAELAEDDALFNAANTGDIHRETAARILQKDPSLITDDERRDVGKTFVFGLSYGLTKYGIVKRLNCTDAVAQSYIDRFFNSYKKTKIYMDATELFVKENGYVKSKTGRYRRFPIWNDIGDKSIREAINMPVQALAGDILMFSLIGLQKFLDEIKAKSYLCMEVHDSLMLNLHKSEHYLIPFIKDIMLNYFRKYIDFKYPLAIDMKIGPSWGSMKEVKE